VSDLRQDLIRSVAAESGGPRAVPFNVEARAYEAFSLGRDGKDYTSLYEPLAATTLKEALAETTSRWAWDRGDRLGIRELGGRVDRLHVYAVRRKGHGVRTWNGHIPATEYARWLDHICTIDLNIINGIDVVGVGSERVLHEHRQRNGRKVRGDERHNYLNRAGPAKMTDIRGGHRSIADLAFLRPVGISSDGAWLPKTRGHPPPASRRRLRQTLNSLIVQQ
jgi:hypothetical protein